MQSTIDAAELALLAIVRNTAALSAVTVLDSPPTKDEDYTGEMFYLRDVEGDDDWDSLGAHRRRETYAIGVSVFVEQWGDDPGTLKTRARAIWSAFRDALVDDLSPGGAARLRTAGVIQFDRITYRQILGPSAGEKWGSRIDGQITFTARTV